MKPRTATQPCLVRLKTKKKTSHFHLFRPSGRGQRAFTRAYLAAREETFVLVPEASEILLPVLLRSAAMAESKLGTNNELIIRHTWAKKERETRIKTTINIIDTRYLREKKSNILIEHNSTEFPSFRKEADGNQYADTTKKQPQNSEGNQALKTLIIFHVLFFFTLPLIGLLPTSLPVRASFQSWDNISLNEDAENSIYPLKHCAPIVGGKNTTRTYCSKRFNFCYYT